MRAFLGSEAASKWTYLAEGALHLVVRCSGTDDPLLAGKVLRLRKAPNKPTSLHGRTCVDSDNGVEQGNRCRSVGLTDEELWKGAELGLNFSASKEQLTRDYVAKVLLPALGGDSFLDLEDVVAVDREFLFAVSARVALERRVTRSKVSAIDVHAAHAALLPNYNVMQAVCSNFNSSSQSPPPPVYSVEIKPKCGFLPTSLRSTQVIDNGSSFTDGNNSEDDVRCSVSRYVMHQALKLADGTVRRVSAYDPLDLFSGEPRRVRTALHELTHNPQNNLVVRCDGAIILDGNLDDGAHAPSGTQAGSTRQNVAASEELERALAGLAPTSASLPERGDRATALLLELVGEALARSGVLTAVLDAQRLDNIGAQRAEELYLRTSAAAASGSHEDDELLTKVGGSAAAAGEADDDPLKALRDFVVAATFKDCSIMLTLQRLEKRSTYHSSSSHVVVDDEVQTRNDTNGGSDAHHCGSMTLSRQWQVGEGAGASQHLEHVCMVRLVDLDMKSVRKVPQWAKLDREVVAAYKKMHKSALAEMGGAHMHNRVPN